VFCFNNAFSPSFISETRDQNGPNHLMETANSFSIHSSQAKNDFLHSKPFQSGQNRLPPFQRLPVGPETTSYIPSLHSQAKTELLHSKPFKSGQNQLLSFQAIPVGISPVGLNTTPSILCHSSRTKTNFLCSKQFPSGQNGLPRFQAIPVRPKTP
jgi:hypothetical protein